MRLPPYTRFVRDPKRQDCKDVIGLLSTLTKNSADPSKQKIANLLRRWKQVHNWFGIELSWVLRGTTVRFPATNRKITLVQNLHHSQPRPPSKLCLKQVFFAPKAL